MTIEFPKGRTAFLVIHGIGEQNPFETLDSFARGVISHLKSEDKAFDASHQIIERKGGSVSGLIATPPCCPGENRPGSSRDAK